MGDKSSNVTKSGVKPPPLPHMEKRELSTPNRPQSYDKKLKLAVEEEMEDEEEGQKLSLTSLLLGKLSQL